MSFEILGSRVLAPNFGSSVYVWGSLITVVMAGLSLGYYVGGRIADRVVSLSVLALLLFVPSVFIAAFPLYGERVCDWLFALNLEPRLGSLFGALCLFLVPAIFLGTVSPYSVQILVKEARHAGRNAGTLYAVSTFGSIVGTLGTSFFLILFMGTRRCMLLLGVVLLALSVCAFALGVAERHGSRSTGRQGARRFTRTDTD